MFRRRLFVLHSPISFLRLRSRSIFLLIYLAYTDWLDSIILTTLPVFEQTIPTHFPVQNPTTMPNIYLYPGENFVLFSVMQMDCSLYFVFISAQEPKYLPSISLAGIHPSNDEQMSE